nr:unnamed protein product [Fasciola hepatica]
MWIHRQKLLEDSLSIQKLFHEAKQLDAMMGRQEGRLIDKDLLKHASTGHLHCVNVRLQTVNIQLEESKTKEKLLDELKEHAAILQQASPTTIMKVDQGPDLNTLEKRYWLIRHEVEKRSAQINAQKYYHRLLFDLGDEQIWIRERINVANNQDVGRSLLAVNHLIRQHRSMLQEVAVRDAHVESLLKLIYAVRRHTYLARCEELHEFIREKATQLPDDVGADFKIICQQVSQQNAFEQDFQATELQVQMINQTAEQLLPLYAGKWTKSLVPKSDTCGPQNRFVLV